MTQAPIMPLHMRRDRFAPVDELRELREGEGVRRFESPFGANVWIVTRYADVREVLGDATRFSNRMAFRPPSDPRSEEERDKARAGQLLAFDPPEHTRLRRLLTPEFTVRRMHRLEPRIVEIVDQHLDAMAAAGSPADLVQAFALPIPSLVICELLGVPYADRAEFQARTARQLDLSIPIDERVELGRAGRAYMETLVAQAKRDPGEDMLGMLVREHAGEITDDELVGIGNLLLIAGHETTSNMLGLGTLALLQHPDQLALVRDDPAAAAPAVEELLRWLTIVHSGVVRTATADVEIAGHTDPGGRPRGVLAADGQPRSGAGRATPSGSTSPAARPVTSRSATACTTASARRSPAWRCGSRSRRCCGGSLGSRWTCPLDEVPFRAFHFIYGLQALPVRW